MAGPNDRLKTAIRAWEQSCPENASEVADVRKAKVSTASLERELTTAKIQYRRRSSEYGDFTEKDIAAWSQRVKDYQKKLRALEFELSLLRRWLVTVRASSDPLPFALVIRGSDQGSLHVFKNESQVGQSARAGKQELSGAKVYKGTCEYKGGRLVFTFESGARASWKPLLQRLVNQSGANMNVAVGRSGGDSDSEESAGR